MLNKKSRLMSSLERANETHVLRIRFIFSLYSFICFESFVCVCSVLCIIIKFFLYTFRFFFKGELYYYQFSSGLNSIFFAFFIQSFSFRMYKNMLDIPSYNNINDKNIWRKLTYKIQFMLCFRFYFLCIQKYLHWPISVVIFIQHSIYTMFYYMKLSFGKCSC